MKKCIIDVNELSNPCITRNRGEQAATKLSYHLSRCPIEIDLNKAELVSLSFLDELICRYITFVKNGNITFITNDKNTENKLSRVALTRSINIYCRNNRNKESHIVSTQQYSIPTPILAHSKD